MRYALSLPCGGGCADPRILAEFAQVADAAGWDAVLLAETTFMPPPVQWPRIPIWVGGWIGTKPVLRRAARYDGMCAYKVADTTAWSDFTPDDVTALRTAIERQRSDDGDFDIVIGGRERAQDWEAERELIRGLAQAGATWWHEWVPAADEVTMRRGIARGPLRVAAASTPTDNPRLSLLKAPWTAGKPYTAMLATVAPG